MIHIILGTRAQLIKMAPVMLELQKRKINYNFIFLAEHKETMYSMLDMFGLKRPDVVLGNLNKDITSPFVMAKWSFMIILTGIIKGKEIFRGDKKGIVLVHGDAPPAFLGALIAKFSGLKVGHIESGLRSFNILKPFPEEIIRILTFNLTNYYFAPGNRAVKNLKKYRGKKINTINNTLLDSLRLGIKYKSNSINIPKEKYCIATIHRFENISEKKKFLQIINHISNISKKIKVLFILHPPTKEKLKEYNLLKYLRNNKNIELRPRYDYFDFINLIKFSEFLLTDGGSNQEEAYYLGKPCLIMRSETEREEGLGYNAILSKFDKKIIDEFIENYKKYNKKRLNRNNSPSKIIIEAIMGVK